MKSILCQIPLLFGLLLLNETLLVLYSLQSNFWNLQFDEKTHKNNFPKYLRFSQTAGYFEIVCSFLVHFIHWFLFASVNKWQRIQGAVVWYNLNTKHTKHWLNAFIGRQCKCFIYVYVLKHLANLTFSKQGLSFSFTHSCTYTNTHTHKHWHAGTFGDFGKFSVNSVIFW